MIRPHDWRVGDNITAEKLQRSTQAIRELQNRIPLAATKKSTPATQLCPLSRMAATDGTDQFTINEGAMNAAGEHKTLGGTEAPPVGHTFTAVAGDTAWCECVIAAEVLENTLTGNWTVDPATMLLAQGTMPSDHDFTPDADTGKVYAPLGTWDAEKKWAAHGCGDVTILFCAQSTQSGFARFYRG